MRELLWTPRCADEEVHTEQNQGGGHTSHRRKVVDGGEGDKIADSPWLQGDCAEIALN